ncbi:MAG: hypothetical protein WBR26_05105 [Candidatus Acidiferrum sp.]
MSRRENIKKRTQKLAKAQGKHINEAVLTDYGIGMKQQYRGELSAKVIEEFLALQPKHIRDSFERMAKDLQTFGRENPKRFRAKVMTCFMIAFHNGTVEGQDDGVWDPEALIDQVAEELNEKYIDDVDDE